MGPIRQEQLSGLTDAGQVKNLRDRLGVFHDPNIHGSDYERAAEVKAVSRLSRQKRAVY